MSLYIFSRGRRYNDFLLLLKYFWFFLNDSIKELKSSCVRAIDINELLKAPYYFSTQGMERHTLPFSKLFHERKRKNDEEDKEKYSDVTTRTRTPIASHGVTALITLRYLHIGDNRLKVLAI